MRLPALMRPNRRGASLRLRAGLVRKHFEYQRAAKFCFLSCGKSGGTGGARLV